MPTLPDKTIARFDGLGALLIAQPTKKSGFSQMPKTAKQIVERAIQAHLNFIEVQLQYGDANKLIDNPIIAQWFDSLLIAAHQHHINIIAWIVARNPSVAEEKNIVQTLAKRNAARGESVDGVALDVEQDNLYMGNARVFPERATRLIKEIKQAIGPYPLTLIIPKPATWIHFPAQAIQPYVSLVAPMIFWHPIKNPRKIYDVDFLNAYCQKFLAATQALFDQEMPIGAVLQSSALTITSQEKPSKKEIAIATEASKQFGVNSIAYFKWDDI